uniref:SCP domain-containing protein n=1 Tax=Trichuris muris TaxID=70415 RepID=A0A5S6PYQ7_TRIMR
MSQRSPIHSPVFTAKGILFSRCDEEQVQTAFWKDKGTKESASRKEAERRMCKGSNLSNLCHLKATCLAFAVILSLSDFSAALAGKSLPLSEGYKYALMNKINELRSSKNALRMDCIRLWNYTLAAYAQSLANKCSSLPPRNPKYPVTISAARDEAPENAFEEIVNMGAWYNRTSRLCQTGDNEIFSTEQCQNFRQFYRYEGRQVGCAKSMCETITPEGPPEGQAINGPILWVCAFSSRATPQLLPYVTLPDDMKNCEACTSEKSLCGAATKNLCCDAPLYDLVVPPKNTYSSNGRDNLPPTRLRINVFLYKDNILDETVVAFEGLRHTYPEGIPRDLNRYTKIGPIGSVVKLGAKVPACKHLKQIHQLYLPVMNQRIYVTDEIQIHRLLKQGYEDKGAIGQTVSELQTKVTNTTDELAIMNELSSTCYFGGVNFIVWAPTESASTSSDAMENTFKLPLVV